MKCPKCGAELKQEQVTARALTDGRRGRACVAIQALVVTCPKCGYVSAQPKELHHDSR